MNQQANPDQQVEIGGKSYTLRFSVKAQAALQDYYGLKSLSELVALMNSKAILEIADLVAILWASLRRFHPSITKDQAMDMIDDLGIEAANEVINAVLVAGNPVPKEGETPGPPRNP